MKYRDGSCYEGYWRGGKPNGKGVKTDSHGRRQ